MRGRQSKRPNVGRTNLNVYRSGRRSHSFMSSTSTLGPFTRFRFTNLNKRRSKEDECGGDDLSKESSGEDFYTVKQGTIIRCLLK